MSNAVQLLLLNLGGPANLQPGEYCAVADEGTIARPPTVTVCCPLCSHKHDLTETHHIAESGRVRPAFQCPACPLLEWIELGDWGAVK